MSRETDITPELTARVCKALKLPITRRSACARAGISKSAFYEWLAKGEKGEQPYADFLDAVTHAEAECEGNLIEEIVLDQDWRAKAWVAERRFRDQWAKDSPEERKREPLEIRLVGEYDERKRAAE